MLRPDNIVRVAGQALQKPTRLCSERLTNCSEARGYCSLIVDKPAVNSSLEPNWWDFDAASETLLSVALKTKRLNLSRRSRFRL